MTLNVNGQIPAASICAELVKEEHKIDNAAGKNMIAAAAGKPKAAADKNKRAQLQLKAQ